MKTIKKDELFQNLSRFLKLKGVELKDGVYTLRIRQACNLLGDAINTTQRTARKAREEVDRKLDRLRQSIHETTASNVRPAAGATRKSAAASRGRKPKRAASRPAARPRRSSRRK